MDVIVPATDPLDVLAAQVAAARLVLVARCDTGHAAAGLAMLDRETRRIDALREAQAGTWSPEAARDALLLRPQTLLLRLTEVACAQAGRKPLSRDELLAWLPAHCVRAADLLLVAADTYARIVVAHPERPLEPTEELSDLRRIAGPALTRVPSRTRRREAVDELGDPLGPLGAGKWVDVGIHPTRSLHVELVGDEVQRAGVVGTIAGRPVDLSLRGARFVLLLRIEARDRELRRAGRTPESAALRMALGRLLREIEQGDVEPWRPFFWPHLAGDPALEELSLLRRPLFHELGRLEPRGTVRLGALLVSASPALASVADDVRGDPAALARFRRVLASRHDATWVEELPDALVWALALVGPTRVVPHRDHAVRAWLPGGAGASLRITQGGIDVHVQRVEPSSKRRNYGVGRIRRGAPCSYRLRRSGA